MVDLFIFPPKHKLYSLLHSHSKSMVLINTLAMFPSTGNNAKMSVEFEGKQNTWLKGLYIQLPVNQKGHKPHTQKLTEKILMSGKLGINPTLSQRKAYNTKVFYDGQLTSSGFTTFRVHRQIEKQTPKHFRHSSKVKQPKEYCPQTVGESISGTFLSWYFF